ncbi:MAG: UDP-N-acetylmuramoyl-L-alanyl-D-glutamate--2,6-diaminopimelate ligase [Ignavibacteriales bacterium]|nr:UDP-N-acetylmuramoyl-L-alanyl-D-glutamate--2,6-diaminopimelate ligase [Ignavibacteriales bacterium]
MKLSQLLEGVPVSKMFQTMFGHMVVTHEVEVHALQYDSRKIERGDCFIAIRGAGVDGHRFTQEAIAQGAKVLILEDDAAVPDSLCMHQGVVKVVVPDSRSALALLAANFYDHPSKRMRMIGVTGTNGKTTTTYIIKSILEASGEKVGLMGTIEYQMGTETIPASHTTPESLELNQMLARMAASDCSTVSMEVSSHALQQSRVHGINYQVAVFTNLTQDHLDYHGSMEEYFKAKKGLFDNLSRDAWTITNRDDDWGRAIFASTKSRTMSYGYESESDVRVAAADLSINGTSLAIDYRGDTLNFRLPLVGRFNVYNTLAAISVGLALDLPVDSIRQGIARLTTVKGRFERLSTPQGWTVIIDYAHTPDALEKCLRTIHDILPKSSRGRIVTVFGAGGDRDKSKRPLMGRIVSELSDECVVTSDNPRSEDPQAIIDDIVRGIESRAVRTEVDRRTAIEYALQKATSGDVIVIAGKGHEEYQVIRTERIHFSDREVVEAYLRSIS